jgi:hypothetical protein
VRRDRWLHHEETLGRATGKEKATRGSLASGATMGRRQWPGAVGFECRQRLPAVDEALMRSCSFVGGCGR